MSGFFFDAVVFEGSRLNFHRKSPLFSRSLLDQGERFCGYPYSRPVMASTHGNEAVQPGVQRREATPLTSILLRLRLAKIGQNHLVHL